MPKKPRPNPADSDLIRIMALAFRFHDDDTAGLTADLLAQEKAAWKAALREKGQQYTGLLLSPHDPAGADLRYLKDLAERDAKSIANTWNKAVERHLIKLFKENPRGNRHYYISRMQEWEAARTAGLQRRVAANTVGRARDYAKERFIDENGLSPLGYVLAGPPPVCPDCIRLMGMGVVTRRVREGNPMPYHPNCDHEWDEVDALGTVDARDIWLGR